jgi:calcineurin-like phosphoesterase family protein
MSAYNAGVDINGFKPVTLEQIKANKAIFYLKVKELESTQNKEC